MSTFPGAFVPVAPPADGLRLAFVAARRRRNRKAGASGAAGLLAAAMLLASTGGAADRTLLQQEPLPPSSSTGGLDVLPGHGEPSVAPTSAPAATSQVDVASAPQQGAFPAAAGQTLPTGGDQAASSSYRGVRAQGTAPVSGPMTRSTGLLYTGGDVTCPARKQQERQRGLCTDVYAGPSSSTGKMSMTAEICNVGTATELLSYATARELDLTVRRSGHVIWRWSLGRHFASSPHDLTVGAQECITWTTTWAQVDSHGVPVKAGSYEVVADFDADEVAGPDRHPTYPITISQQP